RRRHRRCYRDWSSDVCASDLKARADNLVPESPRFFYFAAVQQLRGSAQLSKLQCRAHVSPASRRPRTPQLSFVRAYHCRAEEVRSEERRVGQESGWERSP